MFACLLLQNSKVRRFAFELKMQDKSTFLLAADSEAEMEEWIGTLNKILHSSFEQAMQEKRNGDLHDGGSPPVFFLWQRAPDQVCCVHRFMYLTALMDAYCTCRLYRDWG